MILHKSIIIITFTFIYVLKLGLCHKTNSLPLEFNGESLQEEVVDSFFQTKLQYISSNDSSNTQAIKFLTKCIQHDTDSIYKAAKALFKTDTPILGEQNVTLAIQLFHYLADTKHHHILAMAQLGQIYASGIPSILNKSLSRALIYFQQAGEEGHHSSLYNAGHILAEGGHSDHDDDESVPKDIVGALAYFQAAARLVENYPEDAESSITDLAKTSHEILTNVAADADLSIRQLADAFMFGTLNDIPSQVESLWVDAVSSLIAFNDTFVASNGRAQDVIHMASAASALKAIVDGYSSSLSHLQLYLALDRLNDMLGPLAGSDDSYLYDAGKYAEELAKSNYCISRFAISESDPSCFNGAAASAVSYYRRLNDNNGAERVRLLANNHPNASTQWKSILQTPRVFHTHLRAQPWWNADEFSAARILKELYKNENSRKIIMNELQNVIALQEGKLRGEEVVLDPTGGGQSIGTEDEGMQRIFTPYIGVRTIDKTTNEVGAGAWSEYGPLFDGVNWSNSRCAYVPTICNALKGDKSLCSARKSESNSRKNESMWELCGSGTVITILRLRPGSSILPHCGTTNARLIMHFPLIGSEGVKFIVGDQTVMNYGEGDGNPIVFDDSFEHHVYHEGQNDRYIILVVLSHPDVSKY